MPKTTKKSPAKRTNRKTPVKAVAKTSTRKQVSTKQPHITETVFGAFALFVIAIVSLYLIKLAGSL